MLITSRQLPANGNPIRYPSCGMPAKLARQAITDPSDPQRRNEKTLLAASLASIQEKPAGSVSCDHKAAVSRYAAFRSRTRL